MIYVYGMNGDVKEVEGFFYLFWSLVKRLDIFVYNVMINVYMCCDMFEGVIKVYKLMEEDYLFFDVYIYYFMLRMC